MRAFVLGLLVTLAACGPAPEHLSPQQILARAEAAAPGDPRLAELYRGACRECHARADSGAPLVHDHAAWDPRWAKGEATLLDHTISGFNGMPAGGQCFSCTTDDYRALIAFMAGKGG